MTTNNPPRRFTPMSQFATDYPVLPYLQLMGCTSLPDYAENDINTVANIARILLQDVSDVFRVIEQRGFDVPEPQ
ncbi:fructose-bisphosphate aldolase [Pseudomonas sp. XS1P51]